LQLTRHRRSADKESLNTGRLQERRSFSDPDWSTTKSTERTGMEVRPGLA